MTGAQRIRSNDARVAVVTGGASGIGRATVRRLSAAEFRVAVLDIGDVPEPSDLVVRADVTNPAEVDQAMKEVLDTFGRADLLVNNAGITGSAQATVCHETPIEEWDRVMAVNVRGPFLCTRALLPSMIRQGSGHVITVASAAGLIAFPGRCAYTTSKGAALQFTKSLAVDYAASGIRANAVCPGMVETPMTQWRLDVPELRAQVESKIPMGRVARPEEIADAITMLASDQLAYVNGLAFVIDGGWTAW
jgi:NAD(P)-dependent dehydrogenase (short-subunit alcohol dehydrogenase family)